MAGKGHISLSELQSLVKTSLEAAFPLPVWVAAEIAELKVNGSGHCYMELVEKGEGTGGLRTGSAAGFGFGGKGSNGGGNGISGPVPKAQARAVVWRSTWTSLSAYFRGITGDGLSAGMRVLLKVHVTYHELYGFSLVISDIDPSYTMGEAERARQQTIAQLHADGVWDMNRSLDLPLAIQRIAVVSSSSAAGFRDFMQELGRFPYRFDVTLFEAVMQGGTTEETVVAALEAIAARADDFDAVVIIRGGGSQTDLVAFDGYRLCAHIAQFPLPVITGIGHDKDRSVADMVAALELKTPTAVAVWLGEGLTAIDGMLDDLSARVSDAALGVLERERLRIERAARVVSIGATEMTRRLEMRLERLSAEVARRSGEYFLREQHRLSNFSAVMRERPGLFLTRAAERLTTTERIVALRRPENILALGFAIVRTSPSTVTNPDGSTVPLPGRAVLDPSTLTPDQPLDITLAKGRLKAKTVKP